MHMGGTHARQDFMTGLEQQRHGGIDDAKFEKGRLERRPLEINATLCRFAPVMLTDWYWKERV